MASTHRWPGRTPIICLTCHLLWTTVEPDFDRRWDHLLEMISEERGWSKPTDREYPQSADSHCWPMPYTPLEGILPGSGQYDVLSGQVVIVEATWEFNGADAEIAPRLRTAAGWVPEVDVEAGRIPQLHDVVFLPLTAIGDGGMPEERSTADALSGVVESMLAYDELLARSALAGVQFPREYEGARSSPRKWCSDPSMRGQAVSAGRASVLTSFTELVVRVRRQRARTSRPR